MATKTRYWRLDSTTGGDGTANATTGSTRAYESLEALIAAEATDLDTANDILHAICTEPGREVPSTTFMLNGFTTSAADYVIIECQGDARHNGVSRERSGAGYQLQRSGDGLRGRTQYYRLKGIELSTTGTSYSAFEDFTDPGVASSDWRFDECLFTATAGASTTYAVSINGVSKASLTNCLLVAPNRRGIDLRKGAKTVRHMGIVIDGTYAVMVDSNTDIKNSYAIDGSSENWYGEAQSGSSYNASIDGTAPNDNEVTIIAGTSEFTNYTAVPSTADLTLKDSLLNGAGTGSEAIDITGAARTGTADIGPFNYDAGGGNDITATAPLTFGSDATLNATGDLVAAAALAFASSADMKAAGELTGSAALIFGSSAVLNASGDMVAVDAMGFGSSADLNALGEMAAAATVTFGFSADLLPADSNELVAAAALAFGSSAALNAPGEMAAAAALAFTGVADLNAVGQMTASAALAWGSSAALSAQGELVAGAALVWGSSAALSAQGELVAGAALVWGSSAALSAQGEMVASATIAFASLADLQPSTSNDIIATAVISFGGVAALNATGSLAASTTIAWSSSADLLPGTPIVVVPMPHPAPPGAASGTGSAAGTSGDRLRKVQGRVLIEEEAIILATIEAFLEKVA